MSALDNKFRVYLVFEDGSSYGVSLMKTLTYDGLVTYVNKKFKLNNEFALSFYYIMSHGPVNIVDDEDVQFFATEICRPKLFIKKVVKKVKAKVKPSSSNTLDFDLNDSLFTNDFEPTDFNNDFQMPKDEPFENYNEFNQEFGKNYVPTSSSNEQFKNFGPTSSSNEQFVHKWAQTNTFENMPPIPDQPLPFIKELDIMDFNSNSSRILKSGDEFDDKDWCMFEIGKKALIDGRQFRTRKSDKLRYDVVCFHQGCDWKIVTSRIKNSVKWRMGIKKHGLGKIEHWSFSQVVLRNRLIDYRTIFITWRWQMMVR